MTYAIIIPAHNEALFLPQCLAGINAQLHKPTAVIIVNDNSTDDTARIAEKATEEYTYYTVVHRTSSAEHMPGSKVVHTFNTGLDNLNQKVDFIVKLDADIILPPEYMERISEEFKKNTKLGIAGGFVYEKDEHGVWQLNHPMNKKHVRGAFKAYTNSCFTAIGGLKPAMGWDTVDELLAQYQGFEIETFTDLKAKHLRPTGKAYHKKAKLLQGKAMFTMRYGFLITLIASLKMALSQKKAIAFIDNMRGYFQAKQKKSPFLVSQKEGQFIRSYRWKGIKTSLFNFRFLL